MSDDDNTSDTNRNIRVNTTLTVRDMVYIMITIVSITTTFMMYGTRLSVVEEKLLTIGNHLTEIKTELKEIREERKRDITLSNTEIYKLEKRLRTLEEYQARLKGMLSESKKGP